MDRSNGSPSRDLTAFLEPFEGLLGQVEAARSADAYPFYPVCEDPGEIVLLVNDYLGLSRDARVREAARDAIAAFGTSRCSSPLAGGYTRIHAALEDRLRHFLGRSGVALFASGYQANVGIIAALMQPGDLIVTDLFNHASIVDGARLSGAEVRVFQHNSPRHLEMVLRRGGGARTLVIVEGVYSADGDIACLPEICDVAHAHGAVVMVDEAHSLGVLGQGGRGAAEHFGVLDRVDLLMGTASKSLASAGGFVVGHESLVDVIRHNARSLIFSAAMPPANAAAALTSLEILEAEPERRDRLWRNARHVLTGLRERGFDTLASETPVIPILVGDAPTTLEFAARLRDRKVHACAAIPPMVPGHRSRLRLHVTAAHEPDTLERALATIEEVGEALGLIPARPLVAAGGGPAVRDR